MKHLHSKIWETIRIEADSYSKKEPLLSGLLNKTITEHNSMSSSLAYHLSLKLDSLNLPSVNIRDIIEKVYHDEPSIVSSSAYDLEAIFTRDPAATSYVIPFLFYKGFHALQMYRIAHSLWVSGRTVLAYYIQNRMAEIFAVDIHPAAIIGRGVFIDHGTSIVIGETAVIENNVSMLHEVTLGGTGKDIGDRHPKIREGVLIGAGAKILGNIEIGRGAKVGSGSVVLRDVPAHMTVAGVPSRGIGKADSRKPALSMSHSLPTEADGYILDFQI